MSRGYVFSYDAALGTLLAIIILWAVLWELRLPGVLSEVQVVRRANDALEVLIEGGTMESMEEGTIEEGMEKLLPRNYRFRLLVSSHSHSGSGFEVEESVSVGDNLPLERLDPETATPLPFRTERTFVTLSGNEIESYHRATMWVWLE